MPTTQPEQTTQIRPDIPTLEDLEIAIREGVQDALWRHRKLGETIVGSVDGKIVELTGEEIPVDEETMRRNEIQRRGTSVR